MCSRVFAWFPIGRWQEKAGEERGKGAPDSAANSKGPADGSQQKAAFHSCCCDKLKVPGLYIASRTLSEQCDMINYAKENSSVDIMYCPLFSQLGGNGCG